MKKWIALAVVLSAGCEKREQWCGRVEQIVCAHTLCRVFLVGPKGTYITTTNYPVLPGETICL